MKPAPFAYESPTSVEETLGLLAQDGDDTKLLAGGQSLVPLLNFRLAQPERLIDLNEVAELAYIREESGTLRIGAMTRQIALERSEIAAGSPLLGQALRWVGHVQIRNRGTVGGSIAHADPAAEIPAVCAALDATFHVRAARGGRTISWEDFFVTHLTTSLEPDELLVEIEVPLQESSTGTAFVEFARRHGDFALGGAAATVTLDPDGTCQEVRLALLGATPTPLRMRSVERALVGQPLDDEAAREAEGLVKTEIEPSGDTPGSARYRRELIAAMARRALVGAAGRTGGDTG